MSWAGEGFQDSFVRWRESTHPDRGAVERFAHWYRRVLIDPYDVPHATPHIEFGPGWWFASIPNGDGTVIAVHYLLDDGARIATCVTIATLQMPI